jgi:hypothetical protein
LDITKSDVTQKIINGLSSAHELTIRMLGLNSPSMQNASFEVGDIIGIQCPGFMHVGVYVGPCWFGDGCVVHNSKLGGVILSSLYEFSGGAQITIRQKATCYWHQRETIARRALSLLGKKYDLFKFNCEHAAYYAQRGKAESPQISVLAVIALIFGGGLLIAASRRA